MGIYRICCSCLHGGIWAHFHEPEVPKIIDKDYQVGNQFMELLCQGNYEKAYEYIDMEEKKQDWLGRWFEEEELVNIKEDGLKKFCELAAPIEELGGIEEFRYVEKRLYGCEDEEGTIPIYQLIYRIYFNEKWHSFSIYVSEGKVDFLGGGGSLWTDPLASSLLIIAKVG